MSDIDHFIAVFRAYCDATGRSEATASSRFLGGGSRFSQIVAGGDVGARNIRRVIDRIRNEWPEGRDIPVHLFPVASSPAAALSAVSDAPGARANLPSPPGAFGRDDALPAVASTQHIPD
jgi:hypothetical protein